MCRPVALLPGKKPLPGSFPPLVESLFLTPRLKSLFSEPREGSVPQQRPKPGWQQAPEQQRVPAAPGADWGQKGTHTARGAAGGVEGGREPACHVASPVALSKEKKGVSAEGIEDKSRARLRRAFSLGLICRRKPFQFGKGMVPGVDAWAGQVGEEWGSHATEVEWRANL